MSDQKIQVRHIGHSNIPAFEAKVKETAMMAVGGLENYYNDNGLADEALRLPRQEVIDYAMGDVKDECPREVRFLGNRRITQIVEEAADGFEYRSWDLENKKLFVEKLQEAFLAGDPDRYAFLARDPYHYEKDGEGSYSEVVCNESGTKWIWVTGDSCTAIAEQFIEKFM